MTTSNDLAAMAALARELGLPPDPVRDAAVMRWLRHDRETGDGRTAAAGVGTGGTSLPGGSPLPVRRRNGSATDVPTHTGATPRHGGREEKT